MRNDDYINSPLNTSVSKYTYSFSKGIRFLNSRKFATQASYDLPSTKSNRAPSFGFGNKLSLEFKTSSPPPNTYHIQSLFSPKRSNSRSFAQGRQKITFGSFLQKSNKLKSNPSPDRYNPQYQTFSKKGGLIGGKLPSEIQLVSKRKTPGPGAYQLQCTTMNKSGSYVLSHYKNNSSPKYRSISDLNSKKNITLKNPFSTIYNIQQKNIGIYTLSQYMSKGGKSFGKSNREGPEDKTKKYFPGFKYKRFSQFGIACGQ